jgi:hypothetical protein
VTASPSTGFLVAKEVVTRVVSRTLVLIPVVDHSPNPKLETLAEIETRFLYRGLMALVE